MHFSHFNLKPVASLLGGIDELDIGYIQYTLMMTKNRHPPSQRHELPASLFNHHFLA